MILEALLNETGFFEEAYTISTEDASDLVRYLIDYSVPLYENEDLIYDQLPKPQQQLPAKTDKIKLIHTKLH